ncbi:MAG: hypothetical protein HOJ46_08300, partial [Halieaceae bacterium]|nr:hypothetical protein [Halieaceae bacterium]
MAFLIRNTPMRALIRPAALAAVGCAFMALNTGARADDHCPALALSVPESPITT